MLGSYAGRVGGAGVASIGWEGEGCGGLHACILVIAPL